MRDAPWTESRYLRDEQYRDPGNLTARMALHERFSTAEEGWPRWVFGQLGLTSGPRVLELGCGLGRLWIENAERLPAPLALTLADQSREAARGLARRRPRVEADGEPVRRAGAPFRRRPVPSGHR